MKKIFVFCGVAFLAANAMADTGKATLDLAAVFSRALLNDPGYLQAKELRNAATESESQAIAQLLPFFSVSGGSDWNYLYNKKSGFQVVPVAHNAGKFWGRNSFLKHPGTVQLRIGKPISPVNRKSSEITEAAKTWIEAQMKEIDP